jgi:hypothetical protein
MWGAAGHLITGQVLAGGWQGGHSVGFMTVATIGGGEVAGATDACSHAIKAVKTCRVDAYDWHLPARPRCCQARSLQKKSYIACCFTLAFPIGPLYYRYCVVPGEGALAV